MALFSSLIGIGLGSAAAAVGTGLAVGGIAAGVGSIASGVLAKQAADAKARQIRNMTQWTQYEYGDLANYQRAAQQDLLNTFVSARSQNLDRYTQDYNTLIADYDTRYRELETAYAQQAQQVEQRFGEGMGRVRATAEVGRVNTLAAIDSATESNLRRLTQAQAFTGLGGTTFGQAALAAEQRAGALQRGVVEEQYASQLAGIEQAAVSGMTQLQQQRLAGQMGLMGQRVTGGLQMRQQLGQQRFASQEETARQVIGLGSDFLQAQVNVERERVARVLGGKEASAQYAGAGYQTAAAIAGGVGGGIASGLFGLYGGALRPY
jgi:hypothetical protein